MTVTAERIGTLIEDELSLVKDIHVVGHIRSLLVEPKLVMRGWDYAEPGAEYECWDVFEESGGLGIAYSEFGFGPQSPWGLVRVSGSKTQRSMGPDYCWYSRFMDAFFESAASELPIWRVFKRLDGEASPGTAISAESGWDDTWNEVKELRASNDGALYTCYHSIEY